MAFRLCLADGDAWGARDRGKLPTRKTGAGRRGHAPPVVQRPLILARLPLFSAPLPHFPDAVERGPLAAFSQAERASPLCAAARSARMRTSEHLPALNPWLFPPAPRPRA